jgi:tRNA threonylcarbamoyladenosine biosynthesis protein TsaE
VKRVYLTSSPAQTRRVAARLARRLQPGDVVLFTAHLGAGKTTFVQGAARALGATSAALSPTFVVAETLEARVPIHHLDFYRMTETELLAIGVQDYLTGSGEIEPGVVLIEWAERCRKIWPRERIDVRITIEKGRNRRRIEIIPHGARLTGVVEALPRAA